ncbi:MAG: type III secretion system export apparatus subunit SctT [Proteobacteria bacterium]|uniref:Type III secretion system export apparatus subunit SctT n=1 Tax=Candidatus Avisuccinivibrio stercorigallinarum TaxID=2840704 RepID=A0A9D9GT89_9GAMM|nr:type III secretion system export apparatus subunit SctT [Candidatus Avisuccinivibrio stercorigallinarum]
MDAFAAFFASPEVIQHVSAFVLGSVRILTFLSFAVFMAPQLTAAVKMPLLLAFYIPLHPFLLQQLQGLQLSFELMGDVLQLTLLIGKECLIGFVLGYVSSCIFYAVMSAGIIIDNQRGASQAQSPDPFGGAESSPLGTALLLAMVTLFFSSGAFMNFLAIFYSTYTLWPPAALLPGLLYSNLSIFAIENLDYLMLHALLLCAPFVLVALMCDVALGLINRFAPQLNVFILSMPIKSGACAFLILFYLGPFLSHLQTLFLELSERFEFLQHLLGGA